MTFSINLETIQFLCFRVTERKTLSPSGLVREENGARGRRRGPFTYSRGGLEGLD